MLIWSDRRKNNRLCNEVPPKTVIHVIIKQVANWFKPIKQRFVWSNDFQHVMCWLNVTRDLNREIALGSLVNRASGRGLSCGWPFKRPQRTRNGKNARDLTKSVHIWVLSMFAANYTRTISVAKWFGGCGKSYESFIIRCEIILKPRWYATNSFSTMFSQENVFILLNRDQSPRYSIKKVFPAPSESHRSALSPTYLVWLSARRWICECSWLWSIARLFYVLVCLRHWLARINIQDLSRTWFAEIWSDRTEIKNGRPWGRMVASTFGETDSLRISRVSAANQLACHSRFDYKSV